MRGATCAWIIGASLVWALGATAICRADAVADKAAAESLFREGRKLMGRGDVEAACEKFASSQRLEPAIGSLMNLAACEERLNRTASAWVHYQEAAAMARRQGDARREQGAMRRAERLEPKLARLSIRSSARAAGMTITRDGATVEPSLLGTAVPVDPGRHEVGATAPGFEAFATAVEVRTGETVEVEVPALVAQRAPQLAEPPRGAVTPGPIAVEARANPTDAPPPSGAWRIVGWSAVAVAVIGVTAGALFAMDAKAKLDSAKQACGDDYDRGTCTSAKGIADNAAAGRAADRATAGFVVGAVGAVAGTTLWLTGRF